MLEATGKRQNVSEETEDNFKAFSAKQTEKKNP